jgi:hypothetical protein
MFRLIYCVKSVNHILQLHFQNLNEKLKNYKNQNNHVLINLHVQHLKDWFEMKGSDVGTSICKLRPLTVRLRFTV